MKIISTWTKALATVGIIFIILALSHILSTFSLGNSF